MPQCASCGSTIVFGGVTASGMRFCNDRCRASNGLVQVMLQMPDTAVDQRTAELQSGPCPQCGGPGPIDLHKSHRVISVLVMTSWHDRIIVGCRTCGLKSRLGSTLYTGLLGWWGFPWGVISTPIQLGRNLWGFVALPRGGAPSRELRELARQQLAEEFLVARSSAEASRGTGVSIAPDDTY